MFIVFTIFGGYSNGDHLFPFRTEKLSPFAQMVLPYKVEEYVAASFTETPIERSGFRFLYRGVRGESSDMAHYQALYGFYCYNS